MLEPLGKKGRENRKANAKLAKDFIESGQAQVCEANFPHECTRYDQLTWAHNAKRRKKPDLTHAALLCQNAHNRIEFLPADEMKQIVDEIIERRKEAA
nr:YccJ-like protein [uncultured bacterium]